jgi:DNA-binding CsgD family transcriptional regulator
MTDEEISNARGLNDKTAKNYLSNILKKFQLTRK